MEIVITELFVPLLATILTALVAIGGKLILNLIEKKTGLQNLSLATDSAIKLAQITVGELQQAIVADLKAASADGKLTEEEISSIKRELLRKTRSKMGDSAINVLTAARVDLNALILGAADDWISTMK